MFFIHYLILLTKRTLIVLFLVGLLSMFFGFPFLASESIKDFLGSLSFEQFDFLLIFFPVFSILLIIFPYFTVAELIKEHTNDLKKEKLEQEQLFSQAFDKSKKTINSQANSITDLKKREDVLKATLKEKSKGFPTLLKFLEKYEKKVDLQKADYLRNKKHPSMKGSEVVKQETALRRDAEFQLRKIKNQIEYYESIAPFLIEYKDVEEEEDDEISLKEYTVEERGDRVTRFLTKTDYRKLPRSERNQLALDRYWKRNHSKKSIGNIYERYVGYLLENEGYDVSFKGIIDGYEDLGRDLVCKTRNKTLIIQCKNWSKFKTIHEKHIFQFYGTVFQYKYANPKEKVEGAFYTTTNLSDLSKSFAKELKIKIIEKHKFEKPYPAIKCNISRKDGEKIYHLPFDQQYDTIKIEVNRNEFYCSTVDEAESKGFRRAFRWRGNRSD